MAKQFIIKTFFTLFLISALFSCGNKDSSDKTASMAPATGDTSNAASMAGSQSLVATFGDTLDILWVDSAAFVKLPARKIVFAFVFGGKDTLTLNGWSGKGLLDDEFDSLPDLRLLKAKPGMLNYGPGTYFGNVILRRPDVKDIKDLLQASHKKYVLFVPLKLGEHIRYEIFISNEDPHSIDIQTKAVSTNIIANPSPPKKS